MTGEIIGMAFLITAMTTAGNYLLKAGSMQANILSNPKILMGAAIYGISAFGWVFIMQRTNLTVVGVLYTSMTIIILTGLSLLVFKETVSSRHLIGAALALIAVLVASSDT